MLKRIGTLQNEEPQEKYLILGASTSFTLIFGIKVKSHPYTAQKMKFSIKDFFSKCDQIRSFLWIWSHLLKKPLMENFNFCAVNL